MKAFLLTLSVMAFLLPFGAAPVAALVGLIPFGDALALMLFCGLMAALSPLALTL